MTRCLHHDPSIRFPCNHNFVLVYKLLIIQALLGTLIPPIPSIWAFHAVQSPQRQNPKGSLLQLAAEGTTNNGLEYLDDTNYRHILHGKYDQETKTRTTDAVSMTQAVLVDACATWCGPCKLIEPILEQCASKWSDRGLHVVKYDVESKTPNIKLDFLLQGVMPRSLPSLILFDTQTGQAIANHKGVITEQQLDEWIETNLATIHGKKKNETSSSTTTPLNASLKTVKTQNSNEGDKKQSNNKKGQIGFAGARKMMDQGDDYMLRGDGL